MARAVADDHGGSGVVAPGRCGPAVCFGAYWAKGAANYAESLVNLNNPGTHDLTAGTVEAVGQPQGGPYTPTFDPAIGWVSMGQGEYLKAVGGCFPSHDWSILLQYSNAQPASQQFFGAMNDAHTGPNGFAISNVALAGKRAFRNGVFLGTANAGAGPALYELFMGTSNWAGHPHGTGAPGYPVHGFALYHAVLTDAQILAIETEITAMATV